MPLPWNRTEKDEIVTRNPCAVSRQIAMGFARDRPITNFLGRHDPATREKRAAEHRPSGEVDRSWMAVASGSEL